MPLVLRVRKALSYTRVWAAPSNAATAVSRCVARHRTLPPAHGAQRPECGVLRRPLRTTSVP